MFSNVPVDNQSILTDMNSTQSAKRLDSQDPVLVERFSRLVSGMTNALHSSHTVLPESVVNLDKPVPRSLQENLINDVTALEKGIGTIFKLNDMNGEKHVYLNKKEDVGSVAQVLYDYSDFGTRYFVATNYAHKTATSTMEEIQIFTKGH